MTDQFRYRIRKIEPVGNSWAVSTLAGLAWARGTNDGVGISARFYRPWGIAVDEARSLRGGFGQSHHSLRQHNRGLGLPRSSGLHYFRRSEPLVKVVYG